MWGEYTMDWEAQLKYQLEKVEEQLDSLEATVALFKDSHDRTGDNYEIMMTLFDLLKAQHKQSLIMIYSELENLNLLKRSLLR